MYLTIALAAMAGGLDAYVTYIICTRCAWYHFYAGILLGYPLYLVLFFVLLLLITIWGLFFDKKKEINKPNRFYYSILHQVDYVFMGVLRVKIVKRGQEKMPKNQRYLIVQNHKSNFDQMVMIKALKEQPLICVTKPENMNFPIAGPFVHHSGYIPINRNDMREGMKAIEQAASYIKDGLANIAISPEGTRNKTDAVLLPFHPGSFNAGYLSQCPVVISCLKGTERIKGRAPFRRTKVYFDILEVLPYDKYKDMKPAELSNYARDLIYLDLKRKEHF